ncbi:MAG TPA: hypothetical protein VEU08_17025 [Vicinamibacterales bacterium]|nr:hypothetical protein [Vicinamibacterales bacterium]
MDTLNATLLGRVQRLLVVAMLAALAAACSSSDGTASSNSGIGLGSGTSSNDPVSPDFAIAYIKRTLPNPADPNAITLEDDLRVQRVWNGPADVWVRERASPTANEKNITSSIACPLASDPNQNSGPDHDVRDLDTSFDGTKLIFSFRCHTIKNAKESQQPRWTIFEYDATKGTVRQVISDPIAAALGHDVGPHYLPDGRIVFSSTRQHDAKAVLIDEGKQQFAAGIEGNRNLPAFVVHVMAADGTGIHQISFNTGHDLDPSVLNDGRVLFTRWDQNSGAGMHLYAIDPDGGDMQLLYGRNSHDTGNPTTAQGGSLVQFTQARSRPDGKVVVLLLPFQGTEFGGDIALVDQANFVENLQTVMGATVAAGATGQVRMVVNDVVTTAADPNATPPVAPPSPGGRFSSVFPLWDGTNRLLVSWSQCRLLNQTLVVPCTSQNLAITGVTPAPTIYSIWIYDPSNNTQMPIVTPVEGMMYTDVVALQPRLPTPTVIPDAQPSTTGSYTFALAAEGVGILDIKSVYDFDGVDTAPGGIATVRDPALRQPSATRPRFVRVEKAVSLPDKEVLSNNNFPNYAFGVAGGFMREIIGYAPVEPDGSVRIKVPANIAFQISLLDANGRRLDGTFPRHRAWMQIRTGETVVCNGCHVQQPMPPSNSHGRVGLFPLVNTGAPVSGQAFPNTALQVTDRTGNIVPPPREPNAGETMADYRAAMQVTCVDAACASDPAVDLVFTDVWTTTGVGTPDPAFSWTYAQLGTPAPVRADCETNWQDNCRITIHYPLHIAPLWTSPRSTITAVDPNTTMPYTTCTGCHSPTDTAGVKRVSAGQLDLSSSPAATNPCDQNEFTSFCQLLFPHPELDPVTMQPVVVPGPPDPVTGLPTQVIVQVTPPMSGAGANASAAFFNEFATGGTHAGWLSGAELKLISEWLDIGGQYYNDPFAIPPPAN